MNWRPEGWMNPQIGKVGGDLGNVFEAGADAMLEAIREEIENSLLTDLDGKDIKQAEEDLVNHKLPTLFSYRQAYFVGCQAQLQKILALLKG